MHLLYTIVYLAYMYKSFPWDNYTLETTSCSTMMISTVSGIEASSTDIVFTEIPIDIQSASTTMDDTYWYTATEVPVEVESVTDYDYTTEVPVEVESVDCVTTTEVPVEVESVTDYTTEVPVEVESVDCVTTEVPVEVESASTTDCYTTTEIPVEVESVECIPTEVPIEVESASTTEVPIEVESMDCIPTEDFATVFGDEFFTGMYEVPTPTHESNDIIFQSFPEPTHVPLEVGSIDDKKTLDAVCVFNDFCNINGYNGDLLSNGTQQQFSTCSSTVYGILPDVDHLISTLIIEPKNGANINLGDNFTVSIQSLNIEYGFFNDPNLEYYNEPQSLNSDGVVKGHNHIVIQLLEQDLVPNANNPLFFKGLNEASLDNVLSVEINGLLFESVGEYRICTMTASSSHAPVLMPVARRGSADDCIRINIV